MLLVLRPEMLSPQQDQDFKWVSASYVCSSKATLWLRWCHLGANFGDFGAVLKAIWAHFGPCWGIVKFEPTDTPPRRSPWPWRWNRIKSKTAPKHKNSAKTQTCMAVKAKRNQKSTPNPPSNAPPSGPAASISCAAGKIKAPPSRAIWDDDVFAKVTSSKARAPLARPAPTERCGRICLGGLVCSFDTVYNTEEVHVL